MQWSIEEWEILTIDCDAQRSKYVQLWLPFSLLVIETRLTVVA